MIFSASQENRRRLVGIFSCLSHLLDCTLQYHELKEVVKAFLSFINSLNNSKKGSFFYAINFLYSFSPPFFIRRTRITRPNGATTIRIRKLPSFIRQHQQINILKFDSEHELSEISPKILRQIKKTKSLHKICAI